MTYPRARTLQCDSELFGCCFSVYGRFGMFFFPFFLGGAMAATARVGNLLGAGDPRRARVCAKAALLGTTSVMGTILCSVIVLRHKFAYLLCQLNLPITFL